MSCTGTDIVLCRILKDQNLWVPYQHKEICNLLPKINIFNMKLFLTDCSEIQLCDLSEAELEPPLFSSDVYSCHVSINVRG